MTAAVNLLKLAEVSGVSNARKSLFYQSAMILLCSIVEALTYELVKRSTLHSGHAIGSVTVYKEHHEISANIFSTPKNLIICTKSKEDLKIDDKGADFGKYIIFLKNSEIIPYAKYKNLNWVRKERNKIHLQGLSLPDIGYTKAKIDRVGGAINYLLGKIQS